METIFFGDVSVFSAAERTLREPLPVVVESPMSVDCLALLQCREYSTVWYFADCLFTILFVFQLANFAPLSEVIWEARRGGLRGDILAVAFGFERGGRRRDERV